MGATLTMLPFNLSRIDLDPSWRLIVIGALPRLGHDELMPSLGLGCECEAQKQPAVESAGGAPYLLAGFGAPTLRTACAPPPGIRKTMLTE